MRTDAVHVQGMWYTQCTSNCTVSVQAGVLTQGVPTRWRSCSSEALHDLMVLAGQDVNQLQAPGVALTSRLEGSSLGGLEH